MVQKVNPTPNFPSLANPNAVVSWANNLIATIIQELGYSGNRSNYLLAGDGTEAATGPVVLASYTVTTLPSAATYANGIIYVSNGTSNKRLAVSDGTNWRWPDGAVVS